jgi:hypothetical protein
MRLLFIETTAAESAASRIRGENHETSSVGACRNWSGNSHGVVVLPTPNEQEHFVMRSRTLTAILTAGLLFLGSGAVAAAEEAPAVQVFVNSPGWVTVHWQHSGEDVHYFRVQREQPAYTWTFETSVGNHTDKGLQADTLYNYRVCADYADTTECSEWLSARTQPPEVPSAQVSRAPPTVTRHESFHEPSRIRIWWKKNGNYERVLVRWRYKTSAAESQVDVDGPGWEGSYEVSTPLAGTYIFSLKGCTLNDFGAAKCGDWSAPVEFNTAAPGIARVDCFPGTLRSGSPRFAASGRAEYHFEDPPPGYNTAAGACLSPERTVAATYLVHGVWNPTAKPGAWDNSGANTTETFILTFGDEFSPERASRRSLPPDASDRTATITFLTRSYCDQDPWLNANAVCRRTGNNVPQDIREKWPTLLTEPFPHSRNAIPAAERGQLLTRYHQVTGQFVGTARPPVDPETLAPKTSPAIQGQARIIEAAPKQATVQATQTSIDGQNAQQRQSVVDPSAQVALNSQPLPPKSSERLAQAGQAGLNPQPLRPNTPPAPSPSPATTATPAAASASATITRERQAQPADDRGIIVVGGNEARPGDDVQLNPQPLPPRSAESAAQHASQPAPGQDRGIIVVGGEPPQPLPSKTPVLQPRPTTTLSSGPMQTRDASNRYANPQTQIQGTAGETAGVRGQAQQQAQKIQTEQIICRGGESFNLGKLDLSPLEDDLALSDHGLVFGNKQYKKAAHGELTVLMQLNFVPAMNDRGMTLPAGENAQGLTKGATCSFVHRGLQHDDPVGIRFETLRQLAPESRSGPTLDNMHGAKVAAETRADAQTIPEYLRHEDNYWTFQVFKRPYGYFRAVSHGPWKPKGATQIAGTAGNADGANLGIARLTNVKVFPSMTGVGFQFIARPNASPAVELSSEEPVIGRDRLAVFRSAQRMRADRDNRNSTEAVTQYVGASEAQGLKLSQGAKYHYIITVPGDGSIPIQQATGNFTTLSQTIRVRFSKLHLLSLSDNDHLNLTFWANPGEPTRRKVEVNGKNSDGENWQAGGLYNIDQEMVLSGDVERLRLLVEGVHREGGLYACFTTAAFVEGPNYFDESRPHADQCDHANVAKGVFYLNTDPELAGSSRNKPFILRATLGPHGSHLAFDVTGSIEVVRPH